MAGAGVSIQNPTAPLRRVYVRPPVAAAADSWSAYHWRAKPDTAKADDQHAAFRAELERAGAAVEIGTERVPDDLDDIFAYDPTLLTDDGVIVLRPGKTGRRSEPATLEKDFAELGLSVLGRIEEPGTAEGGDMYWLDDHTLLVGCSYRTNTEGIEQLRGLLPGTDVVSFDLPYVHGPDFCLHLMSSISPLDVDIAVAHLPSMPVRLVQLLEDRGVSFVEVPDEEFDSMGANVLALGPRLGLALEGNPETRRRMEKAGVEVRTYEGSEISVKGDGGPTCLTRPLERG
jgi:N-dimethylarginine dimethylaminohydrolase